MALILGLGLALYLPGLGVEILRSPLEVKYALVAREMVHGSSPLLVPHLFGVLYPDKPPLYFWVTAAFGWLGGGEIDELTARLPAALAAIAGLLVVYRLGADLFGPRAGLLSACILATANLFFWYARQGHPDQFLTTFVTVACLGFWRSFATTGRRRGVWVAIAYAAMGLAVLSKGLLGLLLPLMAVTTYGLLTAPLRTLPRRLHLASGFAIFLAVVLAWYAPAVAQNGRGYVYETLVQQHVMRYASRWVHVEPWYYYLGFIVSGFFPWVLFLPAAVGLGWRVRHQASEPAGRAGDPPAGDPPAGDGPAGSARHPVLFPLAWFVTGFVFLSLSASKRGIYLLPLYPAAALLVGWLWDRTLAGRASARLVGIPLVGLSAIAALLAVGLAIVPYPVLERYTSRGHVDTLVPQDPRQLAGVVALLLAGAVAVGWTWRRRRPALAFALVTAIQAAVLLTVAVVRAPQYEMRFPIRSFGARVSAIVPADLPVLSLLKGESLLAAFYLPRPVMLFSDTAALLASRKTVPEPRYALVDGDEPIFDEPGVHRLAEAPFGKGRVVLVRVDPAPG